MAKTAVIQTIVDRLIEIDKVLKPLETEKEQLKVTLRTFGAAAYNGDGGFVTVATPSIASKTGEKFVLRSELFPTLPLATRKKLLERGVVVVEDIMSRAAVAKVEVKLAA